jgi:hypothetical protein
VSSAPNPSAQADIAFPSREFIRPSGFSRRIPLVAVPRQPPLTAAGEHLIRDSLAATHYDW